MSVEAPVVASSAMDGQKDFSISVGERVNFDDLDQIQQNRQDYVKVKETEAKEALKSSKEKEDGKGSPAKDSEEKKPDGDKPKETEGKEDIGEGDAEESPKEQEKKVEAKPKKMLEGRVGEDKYNLDPDMQVPVKVNGKNELVSLKDLTGNFSGKTSWDKKFSELDKERKSFKSEKEQYIGEKNLVVEHMRTFYRKINDPKTSPVDAVNYLVDLMDGEKHTVYRKFWDHFLDEFNNITDPSEEGIQSYLLKKENEFLKHSRESKDLKFKEQKTQEELLGKVHQIREAHKVSVEQFDEAYKDLVESGVDKKGLTAELVCDHSKKISSVDRAFNVIQKFDPTIVDSEDGEKLVRNLAKFIHRGTDLSDEELLEGIKEEYGQSAPKFKELARKVAETEDSGKTRKRKESNYESFEDFND